MRTLATDRLTLEPQMDRRVFLAKLAIGLWLFPLAARAQTSIKARHIGVLSPGPPLTPAQLAEAWAPLRELGWIEGENLIFERRWERGDAQLLGPLAQELVDLEVEVIATIGTPATLAARKATATIPIVMLSAGDPVGSGLVASLAHPGGNVTGYSTVAPELAQKRLALLRELAPGARRVGFLFNPTNHLWDFFRDQHAQACRSLGLDPVFVGASSAEQVESALAELARSPTEAIVITEDVLFYRMQVAIMSAALARRWPSVVPGSDMVQAGGLVSFEAMLSDQLARMATYIDRILRGARPADLPVEQPTRFHLAINLKTARQLGLSVPQALVLRADEVIR